MSCNLGNLAEVWVKGEVLKGGDCQWLLEESTHFPRNFGQGWDTIRYVLICDFQVHRNSKRIPGN